MKKMQLFTLLLTLSGNAMAADTATVLPPPEPYCKWEMKDYAILTPICNAKGDAQRGKQLVANANKGNCLACHQLPIEGIEAFGTIAPPLIGIGSRLTEGQLRLRVVDSRNLNPMSIMPGFYRDPKLINRPAKNYENRTFLTAQELEDVVAYLVTLK